MRLLASAAALVLVAVAARAAVPEPAAQPVNDMVILGDSLPRSLSDFGFFTDASGWQPNENVVPYELNSALFTDYADKYRFIYLPPGEELAAHADNADDMLQFPVGSAIIKSFGYEIDGEPRLLETRILLHREDGWLALPYVWNDEQTEAKLKVAGKRIPVAFSDPSGQERSISYAVPNKNQCKECHSLSDAVVPIGPKLRNLDLASIDRLRRARWLANISAKKPVPDYDDSSASLDRRARAYLDVNCAHCHNDKGSASNSGLFLTYEESDPVRYGIGKRPVAAGRGSGNNEFAIAPGYPDKSILIYRLKSLEPGIAMPEVGRSLVHDEGAALLSDWIAAMEDPS